MNPYLTPTMHTFLSAIRDSEDGYAIQEGIEVWVDLTRFHAATVNKCLRLCLIREDPMSGGPGTRIYSLNEDGENVLRDEKYVPAIVKAMKRRGRGRV